MRRCVIACRQCPSPGYDSRASKQGPPPRRVGQPDTHAYQARAPMFSTGGSGDGIEGTGRSLQCPIATRWSRGVPQRRRAGLSQRVSVVGVGSRSSGCGQIGSRAGVSQKYLTTASNGNECPVILPAGDGRTVRDQRPATSNRPDATSGRPAAQALQCNPAEPLLESRSLEKRTEVSTTQPTHLSQRFSRGRTAHARRGAGAPG